MEIVMIDEATQPASFDDVPKPVIESGTVYSYSTLKRIAVTGHEGRLGAELIKVGCTPLELDITDREVVAESIKSEKPEVIINCAAFTDVDACEKDEYYKKAFAVNTFGVGKLRDEFDGLLIHISTDYIFSGKRGPYSETYYKYDPVNAYGLTKMAGEAVLQTHWKKNSVIVRTTGLYGGCSGRRDFFQLVRDYLFRKPEEEDIVFANLDVSKSLRGNQTYIPHLVEALIHLVNAEYHPKVVNIASKDVMSRYEFAQMIADVFGWEKQLLKPVKNIPRWDAKRPTRGGLKTRFAEKLGLPIYTISEGLEALKNVI